MMPSGRSSSLPTSSGAGSSDIILASTYHAISNTEFTSAENTSLLFCGLTFSRSLKSGMQSISRSRSFSYSSYDSVEKYLLAGIREITGYVQANEDEFVEMITKKSRALTGACVTASGNRSSHRLVSTSWTRLSSGFTRTTSRVRFPMSVSPRCPRIMKRSRKRSNVG